MRNGAACIDENVHVKLFSCINQPPVSIEPYYLKNISSSKLFSIIIIYLSTLQNLLKRHWPKPGKSVSLHITRRRRCLPVFFRLLPTTPYQFHPSSILNYHSKHTSPASVSLSHPYMISIFSDGIETADQQLHRYSTKSDNCFSRGVCHLQSGFVARVVQ